MAEETQTSPTPAVKVEKETKEKDPNLLLMEWINIHNFNDLEDSRMNVKLLKNKTFLNPSILVKTNDYKEKDGFVTIRVQPTLDGLKKLNRFTYNAIALITKNIKEKEEKLLHIRDSENTEQNSTKL